MALFGHPIARELENWWANHGGRHDDMAWHRFIKNYNALISRKYEELLVEHSNGGRFGMSKAGGCTRAAQLKASGATGSDFSGSTRATFFIGHTVEVMAIATLIAAGYEVSDLQLPLAIDPMMLSARDGSILLDGKRTLLSVKSSSYKKSGNEWRGKAKTWVRRGFPELPFEGVRRSQPSHFAQAQAEMHADTYEQALLLYVAKDMVKAMEGDPFLGPQGNGSLTFYAELIPYHEEFARKALVPAWFEAWENVERGTLGRGLYLHKFVNQYMELNPEDHDANKKNLGMAWSPCNPLYCDFYGACVTALRGERPTTLETQLVASIQQVSE